MVEFQPEPCSRLETPAELVFQFQSNIRQKLMSQFKGHHTGENSLLLKEGQTFVLFKLLIDRMRPTHIREGN